MLLVRADADLVLRCSIRAAGRPRSTLPRVPPAQGYWQGRRSCPRICASTSCRWAAWQAEPRHVWPSRPQSAAAAASGSRELAALCVSPTPGPSLPSRPSSNPQVLGTHNSYHQPPPQLLLDHFGGAASPLLAWQYAHPPLTAQLDGGVRSFELDAYWDPQGGLYGQVGAGLRARGAHARQPRRPPSARVLSQPAGRAPHLRPPWLCCTVLRGPMEGWWECSRSAMQCKRVATSCLDSTHDPCRRRACGLRARTPG